MLSFENISVAILGSPVLRRVSFTLPSGSNAALIGRNGAGKTTLARTIMGFTDASGTIRLDAADLTKVTPHRRPGLGIGYAPEDRRLFSAFTVEETSCCRPASPSSLRQKPPGGWSGLTAYCRN
jgi:branched-chain amino acid transport system ATP-binding protein